MTHSLRCRTLLGTALLAALAGCSSAIAFSDSSSIPIEGTLPPPPPPPPAPKPEPPPEPKRVEVTADRIVIHDKILFEVDKAVIRTESHGLMDEITQVMKDNPQILKISIEGHTDGDGSAKYNQTLSDKRAAAVLQYLVDHGVTQARLTSKGFGESKAIGDNATPEGKEMNRRVEFIIVEQSDVKKTYEIDPKTGEKREVGSRVEAPPATAPPVAPPAPEATPAATKEAP
jgi:OOP family OmpA-OmpF porin